MAIKLTRSRGLGTRAFATPATEATAQAPDDALDAFRQRVEQALELFRQQPVTPQRFLDFEKTLQAAGNDACRQVLEREVNRLEPDERRRAPAKVRYQKETYRINKKTRATLATRFGTIVVYSFYYLNEVDGEPGLHPLWLRLGIGAGTATPALLERVARMAVDHTQTEVRDWLWREHGLKWSNTRLRVALAGFRQALLPFRADLQKARLLIWLQEAQRSRGRHRPVLATGRDGIMVPMRADPYQEASTATVSIYNRQRRRLGTIYLGQMPETKQVTLSQALTALLRDVLTAWSGPLPHLAYITDKGSAPDEYYRRVHQEDEAPQGWPAVGVGMGARFLSRMRLPRQDG